MNNPAKELYAQIYSTERNNLLPEFNEFQSEECGLGEEMAEIRLSMWGWWKPVFLIDHRDKLAYPFMDLNQRLLFVRDEDIDWESVRRTGHVDRAHDRNAHFPTNIRGFRDGKAEVEWQLNPDGYYYRDDDGFGMTDDDEVSLIGYIDRRCRVVEPFRYEE